MGLHFESHAPVMNLGMKPFIHKRVQALKHPMSFLIWERALWVILPKKQDGHVQDHLQIMFRGFSTPYSLG